VRLCMNDSSVVCMRKQVKAVEKLLTPGEFPVHAALAEIFFAAAPFGKCRAPRCAFAFAIRFA